MKMPKWSAFHIALILWLTNVVQCIGECRIQNKELFCEDVAIENITIPKDVFSVHLKNGFTNLTDGIFENDNRWESIRKLDITSQHGQRFDDRAFAGLNNLTYLGLHTAWWFSLSYTVFEDLATLITLDFSGNVRFVLRDLCDILRNAPLPFLQEVIVDGIQSEGTSSYLTLDDEVFEALTGNKKRRIKLLSMSNTKLLSISFESISRYGVCNSIEVFIARNVSTVNLDNGYKIHRGYSFYGEPCKTLRTVDISGAKNVLFQSNLWYLDLFPFYCASLVSFFFNTNDIIANDIDLKYPLYFGMNGPKHLDMTECPIKIRKFSFSNSRLAKLNVHTHLNAVTISSFQIADVSSNELEYVSPQFLASSVNIKYINVSTNKLHVMQESHTRDFERLLWALRKLEILDLSQNGIFSIPRLMFINTTSLEYLDLSMNKLQSIDFVIQHLVRLKTFNLQRNWFLMIDENTQLVLDNLNYRQLNSTDEGLVIDLSHNNFICTCDTVVINSIKWMETLPKELLAGDLNNYKCDLDGAQVNIVRGGLQETKSYCRLQKALLALKICLPPTVIAIAAILIIRFIRQRKQRRQQKIDIGLERLRNETFPKKYLVFFSFCSEDAVAATNLFFTELEKRLKDIVDTPRNLVCIGDRNFRPGHPIGEEIIRCIDESAVTILAVSNAFCKKHWCKREIQETYDQDKPIILLMLEHVEPETMGPVLHKLFERYTRAKLVFEDGQIRLEPDWAIFCGSIINLSMKYLDE